MLKSNNDNHLLAHFGLQQVIRSYETNINRKILNTKIANADPLEINNPFPTKSTAPGFNNFVTIANQINHINEINTKINVIIQLF